MSGPKSWLSRVRRDWHEFQLDVNPGSMRCSWLNWPSTCRTAHRLTGIPRLYGRLNALPSSFTVSLGCGIIAIMWGGCWDRWGGVANVPQAGPVNARKRKLPAGNKWSGRALKKSQRRKAHPNLHRRKRPEPEATPGAHVESQRSDPSLRVQFQLEEAFSHRRPILVELLFSPLPWFDQDRAGYRLLKTPPTTRQRQPPYRLGRRGHPPQPTRAGVPEGFARQNLGRTPPGLCPGT
jgi:hypothetical protein